MKQRFYNARVHNGVQASQLGTFGENNRRKLRAIDAASLIGEGRAEFRQNFILRGIARLHQLVRQRIGIKHAETKLAQHRRNGALAAGNSSGQPDAQHAPPTSLLPLVPLTFYRAGGEPPSPCCSSTW